jgi:3-oxoacyl-[acyl-carrier protein] reductase
MIPIDLTGKNCLITGGTRGIGAAISLALAQAGASTAAIYRADGTAANMSMEARRACGGEHRNYRTDVSKSTQVTALADLVGRHFDGRLHALVLNAGIGMHKPVVETSDADWHRIMDTNLTSAFFLVRAFRPLLQPGGSVVAIASGAGHDGLPGLAAYGASKAGLILFTHAIAQDIGPDGIRANVVSPGFIDTEFSGRRVDDERRQRIAAGNALRRVGVPIDVAGAVLFLVSDLASFVTGQTIRVNGGVV